MIQIVPQMKILVAVESVDFRRGIDGMAALCRQRLQMDPFSGTIFVFCNRRRTGLRLLSYDGQGFWLAYKRFSSGRLKHWPKSLDQASIQLQAHELQVLLFGGDPGATKAAPIWRRIDVSAA